MDVLQAKHFDKSWMETECFQQEDWTAVRWVELFAKPIIFANFT
jgi:hypothetical protein